MICHKYNDCCKYIFDENNGFNERKKLFMTIDEINKKFNINILDKFQQTHDLPQSKPGILIQSPENPFQNTSDLLNQYKTNF